MRDLYSPARLASESRLSNAMRMAFGGQRPADLRELRFGSFTAIEMCCAVPDYGKSATIPLQDALLVSLQLCPNSAYDIWEDGKRLDSRPVARGMANICDLRRKVESASAQPFHCVNFTIPLRGLEEEDEPESALDPEQSRTGVYDPVIAGLGMALLPTLEHPESAPHMFVEHVFLALRAHLAHRFGEAKVREGRPLSGAQLRRARAFLEAHLSDNISLSDLAASCSLSPAYFARSFRATTGVPPHRFLVERRVERARELLLNTQLPLSDIAVQCGFADQSHLTKVFRRVLGVTPGSFR